jgi:hypothetical protein
MPNFFGIISIAAAILLASRYYYKRFKLVKSYKKNLKIVSDFRGYDRNIDYLQSLASKVTVDTINQLNVEIEELKIRYKDKKGMAFDIELIQMLAIKNLNSPKKVAPSYMPISADNY